MDLILCYTESVQGSKLLYMGIIDVNTCRYDIVVDPVISDYQKSIVQHWIVEGAVGGILRAIFFSCNLLKSISFFEK